MADNDFGPKWVMTTDEAGKGFAIAIGIFAVAFAIAPAFILGYGVGQMIYDVKILKFTMAITFSVVYFFILKAVATASIGGSLVLIAGMWLLVDYVFAKGDVSQMWLVRKTIGLFKWLFSA
jgi:hypothetical protein